MIKKKCRSCDTFKGVKDFKFYTKKYKLKDGSEKTSKGLSTKCVSCLSNERRLKAYQNTISWISYISQYMDLKCIKCGYSECYSALDFHHVNESTKAYNVSYLTKLKFNEANIQLMYSELKKCVILCSNCHRTIHNLERTTILKKLIR
jgi:hypothetical protein